MFGAFQRELSAKVTFSVEELRKLEQGLVEVVTLIGEDSKDYKPKDMFALVASFGKQFASVVTKELSKSGVREVGSKPATEEQKPKAAKKLQNY